VKAYDPAAMREAGPLLPGVEWCEDAYQAATGAHAVALVTEWNEFRGLDLTRLQTAMTGRVFVDLRNVYRPEVVRGLGFEYSSVGRPSGAGTA
jgi:UDPglucose 6-dehydrogenase